MRDRLRKLDSQELRIFLAFFLVFALFIHWGGANSYSRYDLTRAIVEDGSVDISAYADNTIDKVVMGGVSPEDHLNSSQVETYINGSSRTERLEIERRLFESVFEERDEVYSDKAPLSSVLAVPAYALVDALGLPDDTVWVDAGKAAVAAQASPHLGLSQFLVTLSVSVFFGSLLLVLVYRDIRRELEGESVALAAVLALGLATPLFYYSTTLFGVVTAASLGYLSFYMARRYVDRDLRYLALGGVAGGLAIATEYYAGLIPAAVLTYIWFREREWKAPAYYLAGVVIGTLPLLIYNYVVTGNPFSVILFQDFTATSCQPYAACFTATDQWLVRPGRMANVGLRLLFFPTRGLFFYSPILLFALPGFVHLYRKDRSNLIYPAVFVLFLLFNSSWKTWMAGSSFGPRYLLPAVPFLGLPLAFGVRRAVDRGLPWKSLVAALIALSIAINLTGFAAVSGMDVSPGEYEERFSSFQPIKPGLWPERVQGFVEDGARSPLLEILLGQRTDHSFSYGPRIVQLLEVGAMIESFLLLDTAFLSIAWLLLVLMLLRRDSRVRIALGAGILVVILLSLTTASAYLAPPAFPPEAGASAGLLDGGEGRLRLMAADGDIASFTAGPMAPFNSTSIKVSVNGDPAGEYRVDVSRRFHLLEEPLRNGGNTVSIRGLEGCRIPASHGINRDTRCLSVWLGNVSAVESDQLSSPVLARGWHPSRPDSEEGERWMREEGRIWFRASGDEVPVLEVHPFNQEDIGLEVSVNREKLGTFGPPETSRPLHLPDASVHRGWNSMTLRSEEGCRVPARTLPNSTDARCLSFKLQNLTLLDPGETPGTLFRSGWFLKDGKGDMWMQGTAEIWFRASGKEIPRLEFSPVAGSDLNLSVSVNGKAVDSFESSGGREGVYILNASTGDGWNRMALRSDEGCRIPAAHVPGSEDTRCLSFRLHNLTFLGPGEVPSPVWGARGWHPRDGEEMWMRERAELLFAQRGLLNLSFTPYGLLPEPELTVSVNGAERREVEAGRGWNRVLLPLATDTSRVELRSGTGCRVPTVQESGSTDARCLSFRFREAHLVESLEERLFLGEWYAWEGGERWMRRGAQVALPGGNLSRVDLRMLPYHGLEDPVMRITFNGETLGTVETGERFNRSFSVGELSGEGPDILGFHGEGGCAVPAEVEEGSQDTRCLSYRLEELRAE